jgi:hypothetical protein
MWIALALSAAVGAQTPAPATTAVDDAAAKKAADRKAKQEMVQGTTSAATAQSSTTPLRGSKPPSEKRGKPTKEQRTEVMKGAMGGPTTGAASQYGASAAAASAQVEKTAPKAAKPDMSDPKVREAMEKQKGG